MSMLPLSKNCIYCGEAKPATVEHYHKNKNNRDGLLNGCKTCCRSRVRLYAQQNAEVRQAYKKRYQETNRELIRNYNQRYNEVNRDAIRKQRQGHYLANAELLRQKSRGWATNNKSKRSANERNRKARKFAATGTHTASDVEKQFALQGGKCYWCGRKLSASGKSRFHADHREPLSKGGSNGPENIVCACPTCNVSKGAKMPLEFAGRLF